jgi:hypothetical protein
MPTIFESGLVGRSYLPTIPARSTYASPCVFIRRPRLGAADKRDEKCTQDLVTGTARSNFPSPLIDKSSLSNRPPSARSSNNLPFSRALDIFASSVA